MEFFDVIDARKSIRALKAQEIAPEEIDRILTAIQLAPSAGNLQAFKIVIVRNKDTKRDLDGAAFRRHFIAVAPVVLVFLADEARSSAKYGRRGSTLFSIQDATIAATYAQLGAAAQGLATCWVGAFDEARVSAVLGAPSHLRPVVLMPLGHAAEAPARPPRRSLSELVQQERF
jgi:nitroreductase